jgi:hypothetical protein
MRVPRMMPRMAGPRQAPALSGVETTTRVMIVAMKRPARRMRPMRTGREAKESRVADLDLAGRGCG